MYHTIILYEPVQMKKIINRYSGQSYHHPNYSKPMYTFHLQSTDYDYEEMKLIKKAYAEEQIFGIYMLFESIDTFPHTPIYIGLSERNVYTRVLTHMQNRDQKTKYFDTYYCRIFVGNLGNKIRQVEKIMIQQYLPLLNKQFNEMVYHYYWGNNY